MFLFVWWIFDRVLQQWNGQIAVPKYGYHQLLETLIILRLLQGFYNHLTRWQRMLQIHSIFNLVATLYETRLLQFSIWQAAQITAIIFPIYG